MEAALFGNDAISHGGFTLTPTGIVSDGEPTVEQWLAFGKSLRRAEGGILWWVGDWLNYGETRYGETYTRAAEDTGLEYQTLRDAKWVSGAIGLSRRRVSLSWSHHREVAPLPVADQDELLSAAEAGQWNRARLRGAVRDRKGRPKGETPFSVVGESAELLDWLERRRESWPDEFRPGFTRQLRILADVIDLERMDG
jgi:hypothetical protein